MNNKKDEVIFLDEEGYKKYLDDIEKLKAEISKLNAGRRDAFDAGAGDGWDSPEFEEIERTERRLLGELKIKKEGLQRIQIIEKNNNAGVICIGDILLTNMKYAEDDEEELKFKLIAGLPDNKASIHEISINSPLGNSVYGRKVGDTCSYSVNGLDVEVKILKKVIE